jgi:tripartite-type tricarboxylate transporter receptor subunit TctC
MDAMTLSRRRLLGLATSAALLPALSFTARARPYPTHPVRIILPGPPGGAADILARLIGQRLSERLRQPFVIENRPGAGGNVATEAVARAPADGHTLLLMPPTAVIGATLYDKLSFNFTRDIASIAGIIRVPNVMVVNLSVPARTVSEFIAYANARLGRVNMASGGVGTTHHVAGELFKKAAGIDMTHVPYHGEAPAVTGLIGGQVEVMFGSMPVWAAHVRSGQVRALAVTTATRWDELPEIPTVAESVPGYEASGIWGIGAPRDTPIEIVETLNREINATLADAKTKSQLTALGGMLLAGTPAEFARLIAAETEKWAQVIRSANIKLE